MARLGNHVIEDFAAATSDSAFRDAVLPRCVHACSFGCQTRRFQQGDDFHAEPRVAVEDDVAIRPSSWKGSAIAGQPIPRSGGE